MAGLNEEELKRVFSAAFTQNLVDAKALMEMGMHKESPTAEGVLALARELVPLGLPVEVSFLSEAVFSALMTTIRVNNEKLTADGLP